MRNSVRSIFSLNSWSILAVLLTFTLLTAGGCAKKPAPATLVLLNGDFHTVNPAMPAAKAVAVTGNTITAVCATDKEARRYVGEKTKVVDLGGKFVTPGLIDAHVHFNAAGAQVNGANLLAVADEAGLRKEIERVVNLLDDGEWITEGLWGAYEQWALGDAGQGGGAKKEPWKPHRRMIDDLTPNHPCFLNRFDGKVWLANTAALKAAGLDKGRAAGMGIGADGQATGVVSRPSPAWDRIRKAQAPKSADRLLDESRAGLKALREAGITEVHDIERPDQTARFIELEANGELTCRVWLRPDLSRGAALKAEGFGMGLHPKTKQKSAWLRYGALKGYIDGIMGTHGALFFEPYSDEPGNFGHWRPHTSDDPRLQVRNMEKMYGLIKAGLEAGFVPNVHAIGDRGVAEMLDLYERLKNEGLDLKGYRVIHAQVIRPQDFPRFKALGVIAEVNPYHISDDMRWMEERIGAERGRGAYAFKSLLDNGAMLTFGSDWPGTSAAEYYVHPKYLIYAAVTRKTLKGEPAGGWFPEQKISVEEAIEAYTINGAFAAFEDGVRGSIEPGKLADFTVFDRNLLKIAPEDILNAVVTHTIVDGAIVFNK
ncbi:MAG: amidohydrolase [Candidatus Aminicenantes bacterium]|nr:amidohydrolase [Candidatus Aminicenantes bacterium]